MASLKLISALQLNQTGTYLVSSQGGVRQGDYSALVMENDVQIGLCEIQGLRKEQEDVLCVDLIAAQTFKTLSHDDKIKSFQNTMQHMQNQYGQEQHQGSTACIVTAWKEDDTFQIWTANLGDSSAFLIVLDEKGKCICSERVNTLHNPAPNEESQEEYIRLEQAGIQPMPPKNNAGLWRLPSGLALSRCFGDIASEQYGLSHDFDMFNQHWKHQEGERGFIVVACDGLTEGSILNAHQIGAVVEDDPDVTPDKLALKLVNTAYNKGSAAKGATGSGDNISVAVFEIKRQPISVAVFDGHGGKKVSHALGKYFYTVLQKNMQD